MDKDKIVKTVPEASLIAMKKGLEGELKETKKELLKRDGELASAQMRVGQLESEAKVLRTNTDDEGEVNTVKQFLLGREQEVDKREKAISSVESGKEQERLDFAGREKSVRARELATEFTVDVSALEECVDVPTMEVKARDLALAKGREVTPESNIYEGGSPAVTTKPPLEMSDTEFSEHLQKLKLDALRRK